MDMLHKISFILLLIGGLNWGVFAVTEWDVGTLLGGMETATSRAVYILVGLAALYELFAHRENCKACAVKPMV